MKTKESIAAYNKEYFARPEVIARAKERNAQYRERRKAYKKTEAGRLAEKRYRDQERIKNKYDGYRMRTLYGISYSEFEDMVSTQNGECAICCEVPVSRLHVDHDHTTGKVRGLLCGSCNRAIGLFKDNIDNLLSAAEYLGE